MDASDGTRVALGNPWPTGIAAQRQLVASTPSRRRRNLDTRHELSDTAGRIAHEQKFSAAVVFWSNAIRDLSALATWIEFIVRDHRAHDVPPPNTRVLRKPQRNSGCSGRTVRERVNALIAHYELVVAYLPIETRPELLGGGQIHLAKPDTRNTSFDL